MASFPGMRAENAYIGGLLKVSGKWKHYNSHLRALAHIVSAPGISFFLPHILMPTDPNPLFKVLLKFFPVPPPFLMPQQEKFQLPLNYPNLIVPLLGHSLLFTLHQLFLCHVFSLGVNLIFFSFKSDTETENLLQGRIPVICILVCSWGGVSLKLPHL